MAIISWTAAVTGDWNTATNWSGSQVPGAGDTAIINLPGAYQVAASGVTVANLTFDDATGELLASGSLDVTSSTTIQAGTLVVSQQTTLASISNSGTIIDNGVLTLSTSDGPSLAHIGGAGQLLANVTIDNSGNTLDLQSLGSLQMQLDGTIDGGTIENLPTHLNVGLQPSASNSLTLDNIQIDGSITIRLDGGSLITNSGLAFAGAGGTGDGTLTYTAINSDPGTFQINGTQSFDHVTINTTGGEIDVTGSLTLDSGATLISIPGGFDLGLNLQGTGSVANLGTIEGGGAVVGVSDFSNSGLIDTTFNGESIASVPTSVSLTSSVIDNLAGGTIETGRGGLGFSSASLTNAGLIETIAGTQQSIAFSQGTVDNTTGGVIQSAAGTISFAAAASLTNDGTIASTGGLVDIASVLNGGGITTVQNHGVVEIENAAGTSQALDFLGAGTLKLQQPTFVPSTINDFASDDTIILGVSANAVSYASGELTMQLGGGQTFDLAITGSHALADFIVNSGSASTTINLACFAAGTRIATTRGPVPVEHLREGNRVIVENDADALPIEWIGHRRLDCARHATPTAVWPIRIAADTFGPGIPQRNLFLSPDHAVYADGVLIPVKYLCNGSTIAQVRCDTITYYHVELSRHAVLLAEGLPAESLLSGTDRSAFANGGRPLSLHPDFHSRSWDAEGCAPLVVTGPTLERVLAAIASRALALGISNEVWDDRRKHDAADNAGSGSSGAGSEQRARGRAVVAGSAATGASAGPGVRGQANRRGGGLPDRV